MYSKEFFLFAKALIPVSFMMAILFPIMLFVLELFILIPVSASVMSFAKRTLTFERLVTLIPRVDPEITLVVMLLAADNVTDIPAFPFPDMVLLYTVAFWVYHSSIPVLLLSL